MPRWVGLLLAPTLVIPEAGGGPGLAGMECSELAQLAYVLPRVCLAVCSVGLLVLYAIYYYVFAVGPPRVVCCDAGKLRALRSHCPALFENYWPTVWAPQAHVQTILLELTQTSPRQKRPEDGR